MKAGALLVLAAAWYLGHLAINRAPGRGWLLWAILAGVPLVLAIEAARSGHWAGFALDTLMVGAGVAGALAHHRIYSWCR